MTLCIAALSRHEDKECVVISMDSRVEDSLSADEGGFKFDTLSQRWSALFAGTMATAHDLISAYSDFLKEDDPETGEPRELGLTETNCVEQFYKPLARFRRALRDRHMQAALSVSLDEYRAHPEWFSEDVRRQADYDLAQLEVDAELLLFGLIDTKIYIYRVIAQHNVIERCDRFGVIGSGTAVASIMLKLRKPSEFWALSRTMYAVYEASKIGGILAPGVSHHDHQLYILGFSAKEETLYPIFPLKAANDFLKQTYAALSFKDIPLTLQFPDGALEDEYKKEEEKAAKQAGVSAFLVPPEEGFSSG